MSAHRVYRQNAVMVSMRFYGKQIKLTSDEIDLLAEVAKGRMFVSIAADIQIPVSRMNKRFADIIARMLKQSGVKKSVGSSMVVLACRFVYENGLIDLSC